MRNSEKFVSTGVPGILKSYLNLTNSDILKEKNSYYLTYKRDNLKGSSLNKGDNGLMFGNDEIENSKLSIDPRISLYRYLCDLIEAPSLPLQTSIDSYIKTFELMGSTAQIGGNNRGEPIISIEAANSNENWGRRFLTHMSETSPFGFDAQILDDNKFQLPSSDFNVKYKRKNPSQSGQRGSLVFGYMIFRINNTETSYGYSWRDRIHTVSGPGTNSPFADHNGTFILLSFPHPRPEEQSLSRYRNSFRYESKHNDEHRGYEEERRRPFYTNHVCFKIKRKHTFEALDDLDNNVLNLDTFNTYLPYRYSEDHYAGTSLVDVYATTPLDYDQNNNRQLEILENGRYGNPIGTTSSWYNYNTAGWDSRRRTFVRWTAVTEIIGEDIKDKKWHFSGRYYKDGEKYRLNNNTVPNLEDFEITKDEAYLGKGKIFADADKILYCPLTGYPLRCCSRINRTYKDIQDHQGFTADWR